MRTSYIASVVPSLIGVRLMALTNGRNSVLPASTKPVKAISSQARSAHAQAPTAAEHHNVAAVLRPQTLLPCFMITPAPRKPTPVTTYAMTCVAPTLPFRCIGERFLFDRTIKCVEKVLSLRRFAIDPVQMAFLHSFT